MAELRQRYDLSAANWQAEYDMFSTMKLSLSTIIAVALSLGVVWAEGPVEKATDVAENAADTAKNVGKKVVKGTKKAVNKVVDAVTPDPDARRIDVTLSNEKIDMPTSLEPGKTAFVVKNAGDVKHNFVVRGKDEPTSLWSIWSRTRPKYCTSNSNAAPIPRIALWTSTGRKGWRRR